MKFKDAFFIGVVAGTMSLSSVAEDKTPGSGPNPFSDCGIGAAMFKNDALAVISNVIWDVGTTAVTSATASPETCNGKDVEAAAFIMESYDDLMAESAIGQGEHFMALMDILEVSDADRQNIMLDVRSDLQEQLGNSSFTTSSAVEKANLYYQAVISATADLS